jgi:hypothetical protein
MISTVETESISYGDKITYAIRQPLNTLNVDCMSRYSSLTFTDYLPKGLKLLGVYIFHRDTCVMSSILTSETETSSTMSNSSHISGVSAMKIGTVTYNTVTRLITFTANSYFLNNIITLTDNDYVQILIEATLADTSIDTLSNVATWSINGQPLESNEVKTPVDKQNFTIHYYREAIDEWEEIYSQTVQERTLLAISDDATRAAARENCAGFTGWYFGDPKASGAETASSGSLTVDKDIYLYGRNYCTVEYATATPSVNKYGALQLFFDAELTEGATMESTYPSAATVYWGEIVSSAQSAVLYYGEGGTAKHIKSSAGVYVDDASASEVAVTSVQVCTNCVLYKTWQGTSFDGVVAKR